MQILVFLCVFCVKSAKLESEIVPEIQFCSFFNNRAPTPQPGLKNCTWFKENSCCLQQEIENTFGKVKPLQGASLACQKYVNYLMCYICAPNQNVFYRSEELTVCEEFCDAWFEACASAILKGSVISHLYGSGREFCESRRFIVKTKGCFNFDVALDIRGSSSHLRSNIITVLLAAVATYLSWWPGSGIDTTLFSGRAWLRGLINGAAGTTAPVPVQKRSQRGIETKLKSRPLSPSPSLGEVNYWILALTMMGVSPITQLLSVTADGVKTVGRASSSKHVMTLLVIFLLTETVIRSLTALSQEEVKHWAEVISQDLAQLSRQGLQYEHIQRLYDNAQYVTEYVNGTEKVLHVRQKLGELDRAF